MSHPTVFKISLPTPYAVGPVNVYYLDGPEPILIDTGLRADDSLQTLTAELRKHGRSVNDLRWIFITHHHPDHAGAAFFLAKQSGATLVVHPGSPILFADRSEELRRRADFLIGCGLPAETVDTALQVFVTQDTILDRDEKPTAVHYLSGGETFSAGGLEWAAIHTPGHAGDHLCFVETARSLLFSGDTLLAHITPNPLPHLDAGDGYRRKPSLLEYIESLKRLKDRSYSIAHTGHGEDIADVANNIARNERFIARRAKRFKAGVEKGAATPAALAQSIFRREDPINQYLAVSETVAYLDLLERDGEIEMDWDARPFAIRALETTDGESL